MVVVRVTEAPPSFYMHHMMFFTASEDNKVL